MLRSSGEKPLIFELVALRVVLIFISLYYRLYGNRFSSEVHYPLFFFWNDIDLIQHKKIQEKWMPFTAVNGRFTHKTARFWFAKLINIWRRGSSCRLLFVCSKFENLKGGLRATIFESAATVHLISLGYFGVSWKQDGRSQSSLGKFLRNGFHISCFLHCFIWSIAALFPFACIEVA